MKLRAGIALGGLFAVGAFAFDRGEPREPAPRVVVISVDGLWAGDLARADSAGVRLPVLGSLRRAGVLAAGVISSFPSVTYPAHTTMVTGVSPARHGIYSNVRSTDPMDTTDDAQAWYWERHWVRVPTLFDAAHAAGKRVAVLGWPATVEDSAIAYDLPEIWHVRVFGDSDFAVMRRRGAARLLDALGAPATGAFSDSLKASYAAAIVRRWDPDGVFLHLIDVDAAKHDAGPVGDSVWAALGRSDRQIGWVLAALRATRPDRPTTVIITSDHGFLPTRRALRPGTLLREAGLVRVNERGRVIAWDAAVVVSGGSAFFIPRDPTDTSLPGRMRRAIPDSLVGPERPIRAVWPRDTIAALGGDPRAVWAIDMNDGSYARWGYRGALFEPVSGGGHGHDPRRPELHAFFLAAGPGIAPGSSLPVIRLTDIAPTVAKILGIELRAVEGKAVF